MTSSLPRQIMSRATRSTGEGASNMAEANTEATLREAISRTQDVQDLIAVTPARHLAVTFDRAPEPLVEGSALPCGWHWLYFLDAPASAVLGEDGRTVANGFLPDTGLPRRMWASGSFRFIEPIVLGREARCRTRIVDVTRKQGRSGPLAFITTEHDVSQDGRLMLQERRNLVFREASRPDETPKVEDAPGNATWRREILPDPVLLFRFSALTFNGHRIHYDSDYCRQVEGYPGLVVHGPMLALLLLDLVERAFPGSSIVRFDYRAVSPLFAGAAFAVCGREGENGIELWIEGPQGQLATHASAVLA